MSQHTQDPGLRAALERARPLAAQMVAAQSGRHGDAEYAAVLAEIDAALSATPAHAPGKAGDREGLIEALTVAASRMEVASMDWGISAALASDKLTHADAMAQWAKDARDVLAALAPSPTGNEAPQGESGVAKPCHWGGGNDVIWCSTCGEEYAYAKGEERPACPREAPPPPVSTEPDELIPAMGYGTTAAQQEAFRREHFPNVSTEPDSRAGAEREAICMACFAPGILAGPRGTRTTNEWRADAVLAALHPSPPTASGAAAPVGGALADIAAERRRQVEAEGWTPEHDDKTEREGQLAGAAACYAFGIRLWHGEPNGIGYLRNAATVWPWADRFWKPEGERRNLVKAGALIVAEIERLDRATPTPAPHPVPAGQTTGEV